MIDEKIYTHSLLFKPVEFPECGLSAKAVSITEHPIHFHTCLEIVYVIEGSADVKISYDNFRIDRGEFTIINPYDLHSIKPAAENTRIVYLHLGGRLLPEDGSMVTWDITVLKRKKEMYDSICGNILQIIKLLCVEKRQAADAVMYAQNIITILLGNLKMVMYPVVGSGDLSDKELSVGRLDDILNYLYMHYDEHITLESLAKEFNVSKYYLSHFVKDGMGISVKEGLNLVRADRAEFYVLDNKLTISEISKRAGFSSVNYFNKVFRQHFGCSPSEYRAAKARETIAYRGFSEEACEVKPEDIYVKAHDAVSEAPDHEKNRGSSSAEEAAEKAELRLSLGGGHFRVVIAEPGKTPAVSSEMDISSGEKINLELDSDSDEMILIIKRRKSRS
jgi:xylan 1,4-beta-xylosidase